MNIQKLDKSSKEGMRTLFKLCFNSTFDSPPFEEFLDSDELWQYIWGIKKEEELIASYIAYDGEAKYRNIPFKICYFDGVVSKPGERMKGTIRELMNHHIDVAEKKGIEIFTLDPFKTSFYEHLGYTTAIDMAKYEFPFELVRKPEREEMVYHTDSGFVLNSEKFEKKIKNVLELCWNQGNYNPMKIPDCYFKRMLQSSVHQVCIFEEEKVPKGYILYTVENRILSIRRIIFSDIKVIKTLNTFIYQFRDQVDKVEMDYMPDDLPVQLLCHTMRAGSASLVKTKKASRMLKILDVEKLLMKLLKHSERDFPEFLLTVQDDFIEKNNKTFWLKHNQLLRLENIEQKKEINQLRLNIDTFVQIFTGYQSFIEKYLQGMIAVNGTFSSEWRQFDIPEIIRELTFVLPPLQTYSTEFCY
jgi:predicted acetyltransferase